MQLLLQKIIIESAVSMVELALKELREKYRNNYTNKNKAGIVGNTLSVLWGDKSAKSKFTTNSEIKWNLKLSNILQYCKEY